jgi:hypothetical protein
MGNLENPRLGKNHQHTVAPPPDVGAICIGIRKVIIYRFKITPLKTDLV